jgi:hypothetical protein
VSQHVSREDGSGEGKVVRDQGEEDETQACILALEQQVTAKDWLLVQLQVLPLNPGGHLELWVSRIS